MVLANRAKLQNSRSLVRVFGGLNETYALSLIHIFLPSAEKSKLTKAVGMTEYMPASGLGT